VSDRELQAVYRERVLEHSREPHNCRRLEDSNREAVGFNPLCGDKVTIYMQLNDENINAITFEGIGCAITLASASMMTDALQGVSTGTADHLIETALQMFSADEPCTCSELEEFRALEGVRKYPSRIKCATLPWTAAQAALQSDDEQTEQVTTE